MGIIRRRRRTALWLVLLIQFAGSSCGASSEPLVSANAAPAPAPFPAIAPERLAALSRQAIVRRDRYGVPHILADTEEAAAFAHGFATAEDHGPQLARLFLRARGQLASVFGDVFAQDDIDLHALGIPETAAERFAELPPFMQAILNGYADGYNAYAAGHPGELPAWARPITGVDVLAHARAVMLFDFALTLDGWATRRPVAAASNVWAIGRPQSYSGHGMLIANPHLPWSGSTVFHEVHLTVPGVINVSGATLLGIPVVSIGFNETLGWSHTVNNIDSDDVYELTLDESRKQYAYDGCWLPLQSRTISIDVKIGDRIERRSEVLFSSHYGPVRLRAGKAYALKSANLSLVNFLTQWNAMAKATSMRAFRTAVAMQQLPMFNIAAADRDGNIWYVFNGRIPKRPSGYDWTGVVPGGSKTEWSGIYKLVELPQLLNPRSGYVQNANDAPRFTNLEQPTNALPGATSLYAGGPGWRTQIGLRLLSRERRLKLEQLMAFKYNTEVPYVDRTRPALLALLAASPPKGDQADWNAARQLIERWNGRAEATSRAASVFAVWWQAYAQRTNGRPFSTPWTSKDVIGSPTGLADPAAALDAFDFAIRLVKERYGRLDVAWGEWHRLRRGTVDLPLGGMPGALRAINYRQDSDRRMSATGGDSYVLAVEFTRGGPKAFSVLPYSESSNERSPHFSDQASIYASESFKRAWFSEQDIAANVLRTYHPAQ